MATISKFSPQIFETYFNLAVWNNMLNCVTPSNGSFRRFNVWCQHAKFGILEQHAILCDIVLREFHMIQHVVSTC